MTIEADDDKRKNEEGGDEEDLASECAADRPARLCVLLYY